MAFFFFFPPFFALKKFVFFLLKKNKQEKGFNNKNFFIWGRSSKSCEKFWWGVGEPFGFKKITKLLYGLGGKTSPSNFSICFFFFWGLLSLLVLFLGFWVKGVVFVCLIFFFSLPNPPPLSWTEINIEKLISFPLLNFLLLKGSNNYLKRELILNFFSGCFMQ